MTPAVALSIAGSDSGGGAGIQADLKTFAAIGVFGTTAITAVTAQDTTGVTAIHVLPASIVAEQVRVVVNDLRPGTAKTGMLATAEIVSLVADMAEDGGLPPLVVDPVMVASSGSPLLEATAVQTYLTRLFPVAAVVTPNLPEASLLLGEEIEGERGMMEAARRLGERCPGVIVVKGGHSPGSTARDVVWDGYAASVLEAPWVPTHNVHGTGCTFSAAAAGFMARGEPALEALGLAKEFVTRALAGSSDWKLGAGVGPLDHMATSAGSTSLRTD